MDEFGLAHGAGDFGEGVEAGIEEIRVVSRKFRFPGFDVERAVEFLLEGAELVPGAGEIGTVFHRMLENETGQETDGEVVGGGRESDGKCQREVGAGCNVKPDEKGGCGEEKGGEDVEGQREVFGLFHGSISIL